MPSRSILKSPVSAGLSLPNLHALPFARQLPDTLTPRVHFPSTPSMITSMHQTHAPHIYDRAPIIVSPNVCLLPEREEEEKGSYFHPRAFEAWKEVERSPITPSDLVHLSIPAHIFPSDIALESDDSDLGSPQLPPPNLFLPRSKPRARTKSHSSPSSSTTARRKIRRVSSSSSSSRSLSFDEHSLDGCLGGF